MTRDALGYWSLSLPEADHNMKYLFEINGDRRLPDPASRAQPDGVHEASALVPTAFRWTDDSWKGLEMGDMIIYELHVGTFSSSGDFQGIISKLGYLRELGVNAIELMPVSQFPGGRNWGYDGVYPFDVQHEYGGADGLKALVDAEEVSELEVLKKFHERKNK